MSFKELARAFGFESKFLTFLVAIAVTLGLLAAAQIEQNNVIRKKCNKQTHKLIELKDSLAPQLLCVYK